MLVVVVAMASTATDRKEHVAMRETRGASGYGVGSKGSSRAGGDARGASGYGGRQQRIE